MQNILKVINWSIGLFFIVSFYFLAGDAFDVHKSYFNVFLMLCISGFVFYEYFTHFHQYKFTFLSVMVLLWSVMLIFNIAATSFRSDSSITMIVRNSFWWVIIYLYGTILGQFGDIKHIRKVFLFILPVLIFLFIGVSQYRTILSNNNSQASINYVFFILTLLPFYLTVRKQKYKLMLLFVVTTACFYSMKRSATIIALLSMFSYMVDFLYHNKAKTTAKLAFLIIFFAISYLSLKYVNYLSMNHLVDRFDSISSDGGSGRSTIYINVWNNFTKNQVFDIVGGRGYNTVLEDQASGSVLSAHNDFLEVLYDYGVLGFLIYLGIWCCLFKRIKLLIKVRSEFVLSYVISLIIFFVLSMFSHLIIYPTFFIGLTLFWGYIEGLYVSGRAEHTRTVL